MRLVSCRTCRLLHLRPFSTQFSRSAANIPNLRQSDRIFFERVAKKLNLSNFDDWYQITNKDVLEQVGGWRILAKYDKSLVIAFNTLYPGIFALPTNLLNDCDTIYLFISPFI